MTEMVQGSEVIISNVEPQEDIKHPLNIFYIEKRVTIYNNLFIPLFSKVNSSTLTCRKGHGVNKGCQINTKKRKN